MTRRIIQRGRRPFLRSRTTSTPATRTRRVHDANPIILPILGLGTAINVAAVLVGGGIGTLAGAKLPEGMRVTAMQAIGVVTLLVGVANFLEYDNPLVPLVSVVGGLVVGELVGIEARLVRLGGYSGKGVSEGGGPALPRVVETS